MKIAFDGDSITAAQYVTGPQTFAHLIGTALGFDTIDNTAVSGSYAAGVLNRMPAILAGDPDRVVVMVGTNDAAHSAEVGSWVDQIVESYIDTMEVLIASCTKPLTIFSAPYCLNPAANLRLAAMADALAGLCRDADVAFFDVHSLTARAAATMSEAAFKAAWMLPAPLDLYHWSAAGHTLCADAFLATQMRSLQGGGPIEDGLIPQNHGTPIGDMVAGGGLAAAYDGAKTTLAASCAKKAATTVTSYVGKTFPAPKTIRGFRYYGSSDQGVSQGNTIELQGWVKQGAAPATDIDGVYIGGSGTIADANGLLFWKTDLGQPFAADHVWVRVISTGELKEKFCAEVEFYEAP